uniref:C-type lectin domain-containing protein n=1 Tax=Fundulus heteroclitus TaxID=8078 RepID=A0A3Q2QIK7_FUNHE
SSCPHLLDQRCTAVFPQKVPILIAAVLHKWPLKWFSKIMTRKSCVCIFLLFILPFICGLRKRIFQQFGDKKTWRQAQSFCRQKYTDLITIRNEEESQTLLEYEGWIGLYQDNDRSPWKWSSGDEMATFFKWRATSKSKLLE